MGDMSFDDACWPDPASMVQQLKSMDVELMVTFWPYISRASKNWDEFNDANYFVINATSHKADPYWSQCCSLIDATNNHALQATFKKWFAGYGRYGIKSSKYFDLLLLLPVR